MGLVTRPYTYTSGNTITAAQNESNETTLYNEFNGNIDNANVKSSAAIVESKIAFNTSTGHSHDGTDSKAIPKGFVWTVAGTLSTNTDAAPWLTCTATQTISKVYGTVKTAPTGASILIDIDKSTDNGATWTSIWNSNQGNRLAITATNRTGSGTSFDTTSVAEGNLLRIAVDQVGSTIAGADLTVVLKA